MKQTKLRKFLDTHPEVMVNHAKAQTAANPTRKLTSTLDDIKAALKALGAHMAAPKPSGVGQWLLVAPDGRAWSGPDPLTLAAQAKPISDYFHTGESNG